MPDREHVELFVSLRDYFDSRINEMDRRLSDSIADRDTRVASALQANDRRLDLLNEFRGQQSDESRKYAERAVVGQQLEGLEARIARNENGLTAMLAVTSQFERVADRVTHIEKIQATAQGRAIAIGGFSALFGGAVVAIIIKAIGG